MMSLPELQAWFMTVMTAPGGVERGEALAAQRHGWHLGDVLAQGHGDSPGPGLAPAARMRIYADGYVLRLLDCLRADYPLLCKLLGDDLFQFFARSYVARHPPASPSLYDVGAGFAGFLAASQTGRDDAALRLPVALARLERARIEAGRAPGLEGGAGTAPVVSTLDILMGHDPLLRAPPCLRLLDLETPALAYAESLAAGGEPPPAPEPRRSLVAVTRKDYRIGMAELAGWQYHFLAALAAAGPQGATASAGTAAAARQAGVPVEQVRDGLLAWLPAALAAGLLAPLGE